MEPSLNKRIQEYYTKMSANQKKIANYLLQNYDQAAFFTAAQLGEALNVSESTVIRFAVFLAYDGYPQLNRALQDMLKNKISTVERLQLSAEKSNQNILLQKVFSTDIQNIRRTMEEISAHDFQKAVEEIIRAKRIYIISARSAISLGHFLYFYLQLLLKKCVFLNDRQLFFEELSNVKPKDLVIAISFPRYSKHTVEGLKLASEKGAQTLSITDSVTSPLARFSQNILVAHSGMTSFIDSFAAPLSLINALIIAVGTKEAAKTKTALSELENTWKAFDIYYSDEEHKNGSV